MTIAANSSIVEFMTGIATMLDDVHGDQKMNRRFVSLERLLLECGREFPLAPMPDELKRFMGKKGHCYMNATQLALSGFEAIYCEGYAVCKGLPIPLRHGFCITPSGEVIDPTWKDGTEYFGIPISKRFLFETMKRREVFGILDDWESDYPVLSLDPATWIHPAFQPIKQP
ncbi:MAG: hypothetical protein JWR19_2183 [Pedosphaera sp.]|nr:hypothetical protein [Pedosphaera sp.]